MEYKIQEVIDSLENMQANINNPFMPAKINVEGVQGMLPDIIDKLKSIIHPF